MILSGLFIRGFMKIKEGIVYARYKRALRSAKKIVESGKIKEGARIKVDRQRMQEYAAEKGVDVAELTPKERADFIDPF